MAIEVELDLKNVQLERRIGRGGMADVYLGRHTTLGRRVAVKFLHAHLIEEPEFRRRFLAEARSVAGLRHAHIVEIFDFDVIDGRPYIVMEFIEGPSLAQYLESLRARGHHLPVSAALHLTGMIASALDHAHAQGIVHRDVKPANVLLMSPSTSVKLGGPLPKDVTAVLTDFGVARVAHASTATATGAILGTPAYMAPEQVLGGKVDARTDIYSLGVMVFEMLAGRLPFLGGGDTPAAVLFKHVHKEVPQIGRGPETLQAVVECAMAKAPEDRYVTAGEFLRDLRRAAAGGRPAAVTLRRRLRSKTPTVRTKAEQESKRRRFYPAWLPWLVAGVGLVALTLVGVALAGSNWLGNLGSGDPVVSTRGGGEERVDAGGAAATKEGTAPVGALVLTPTPTSISGGTETPSTGVSLTPSTAPEGEGAGGASPTATGTSSGPGPSPSPGTTEPGPLPSSTPTATDSSPAASASPTEPPSPTTSPTPVPTASNPPTATGTAAPSNTPKPTATATPMPTKTSEPAPVLTLPTIDIIG